MGALLLVSLEAIGRDGVQPVGLRCGLERRLDILSVFGPSNRRGLQSLAQGSPPSWEVVQR